MTKEVFFLFCTAFLAKYGFKTNQSYVIDRDYLRLGRLAAMIIMNTGLPVPIFSKPLAEYVVLGNVVSDLETDDFPPGHNREIANQVGTIGLWSIGWLVYIS